MRLITFVENCGLIYYGSVTQEIKRGDSRIEIIHFIVQIWVWKYEFQYPNTISIFLYSQ